MWSSIHICSFIEWIGWEKLFLNFLANSRTLLWNMTYCGDYELLPREKFYNFNRIFKEIWVPFKNKKATALKSHVHANTHTHTCTYTGFSKNDISLHLPAWTLSCPPAQSCMNLPCGCSPIYWLLLESSVFSKTWYLTKYCLSPEYL